MRRLNEEIKKVELWNLIWKFRSYFSEAAYLRTLRISDDRIVLSKIPVVTASPARTSIVSFLKIPK